MTEDRHLFLDLDGLLQAVRTRTKLQSVDYCRGVASDDLRLNAKWFTEFLSGQTSAKVITRQVTFVDWGNDGVGEFIKLDWQGKCKGKRHDHLSLNTLLRANVQAWGASDVSSKKTLVLAIGDPTDSVLKCVTSYLKVNWSVELYCMQGVWNNLPKKTTMRCRSNRSFKNVFLDGFVDHLVLRIPSGPCETPDNCSSAMKKDPIAQLQQNTRLSSTSAVAYRSGVPEAIVAKEQLNSDKNAELIESARAKLKASLPAQLEKRIQDAAAAFQQGMLVQIGTPTLGDKVSNKSQSDTNHGNTEERHWILPRQTIATTSRTVKTENSNQEEHNAFSMPNLNSSMEGGATEALQMGNTAVELLALKQQMQEMQTAFSTMSMDISSQSALRQENQELRQRLEQQTRQIDQLQNRMDMQHVERLQIEEQYDAEVKNRRKSLLQRDKILQCPVTRSLLETPMVTVCCGNAFSRSSLERVQLCPICRTPGIRAMQSRTMESVVEQFRGECAIFDAEANYCPN